MERMTRSPRVTSPAPSAEAADLAGETFEDFRILRLLGQGGMGQVYLAEQSSLRRKVAIKVIREDVAANPTALERFQAESQTVAQLRHANIVQVYMVGEHKGRHYMVLEYVEGRSLRDYLLSKGPLDVLLVLSIMRQVANALQHAADMGIVHRDIKPENILLTRKGEVKVADFGLSRCLNLDQPLDLTRSGTAVGTPMYMSPEQVEGKAVDCRSDLYSFGVTCYQMLAGETPFTGNHAYEIALKHVLEEPPPLETIRCDVPRGLCAVVHKMMAKKPHARYQSAGDLLKVISRVREVVNGTTGCVPAVSVVADAVADTASSAEVPNARRPAGRRWMPALLALGGVALLGMGVTAAIVWQRSSDSPSSDAPLAVSPPTSVADTHRDEPQHLDREASLRKLVEEYLQESSPNPRHVEDCIDLAVLYLDQDKVAEAEALFKRMETHRPPSAYYFVGRLGLAVTDALKKDYRASRSKFAELFDSRSKDNRVSILNDYLSKNAEFAKWVNEADSHNVRNGGSESSLPSWLHRPGKFPFRRP